MAIESQKDSDLLKKRLAELARKAYERNMYVYTDFLGLAEQSLLHEMERELQYAGIQLQGMPELADDMDITERKIARFGREEQIGYTEPFPIAALWIRPPQKKFAQDLTHRDFLGSLMNLGVERNRLGDLFVQDKEAILFCQEGVADFLMEELTRVRHTDVLCSFAPEEIVSTISLAKPEERVLQVSSGRIDACISRLYNMSRNDSLELFKQGKVYVNGKLCESNSYLLKEKDAVTARGFGKFIFQGVTGQSKKGKLCVTVAVYGAKR